MRTKTIAVAAVIAALAGITGCSESSEETKSEPTLDRFYSQPLNWKSCEVEELDKAGAQCADVTVPLNYQEPEGKTITVAISRIAATDKAQRHGIMLSNSGGPGGEGLDFMLGVSAAMTPEVRARYDLIGMDPRGVGRSSAVNCHWPIGFGLQSAGIDAASFAESVATQKDLAQRCADAEGDRLPYITSRNTARDMDVIRAVLGEEKTSFFGTSYGTYLGSVYMQMFPQRSDRMVLDSAVDPARYGSVDMMRDMGPANEAVFENWAQWAAERDGEYHFGTTRDQVRTSILDLIRRSAAQPIRFADFEIDDHSFPVVLFSGLDDPREYASVAKQMRQLADAADGKTVDPDPKLVANLSMSLKAQPRDLSPQMAIMCGDVAAPRETDWYWRNIEAARATEPVFGAFVNNVTPCTFWTQQPAEPPTVVDNSVPALIVQSTGDTRTTYANAQGMHRALKASRMVTLQDVAIHAIFGRFPNACVWDAVNKYFLDGSLPAADFNCQKDPES
ncbi:alpha/beta hydrolase [Nocardia sp. NPDC051030]|uniref:alpha/beta hydrolase n=1 Tax=Nocardia sp. NPDC051030 TaxID=3155162 RepID=UPI00341EFD4D